MFKVAAVLAFLAVASGNLHDRAFYEEKFFEWLQTHKISANSGSHFVKMLQNFANNHDLIETHNSGNHSYTLGKVSFFSEKFFSDWSFVFRSQPILPHVRGGMERLCSLRFKETS